MRIAPKEPIENAFHHVAAIILKKDSLSEKPASSQLEPHWNLIKELLSYGRTYREIAQNAGKERLHQILRCRMPFTASTCARRR